jgi:N-methylhydantoinase B
LTAAAIRTDPIMLEVLCNRFKAVAEEMAAATLRTAFTVFVKETHDFGACLVSPRGEVFAAPTDTAVSIMAGLPAWEVVNSLAPYEEGDIGIANDPDATRGLSTHLPDIWLWKPIFAAGELAAFALSFIHSSDVGGKVAGSISPSSCEIFEEGLRIPPSRLFRAGQRNDELVALLLANSRIPDQNWGDIKAQIASLNIAERRVQELVGRYGYGVVAAGIEDVMDYAEVRARALIGQIPDGDYEFTEYLEGDDAGVGLIRIKLTLRIQGPGLVLDFTGTDHQVKAAFNLPTWNQRGHRQVCFALLNYFRTADPTVPYNSGLVRPIELLIPSGTLLNPDPGSACGVRAATMFRVADLMLGCLTQALPEAVPAAGSGAVAIVLVSAWDPTSGAQKVEVAQPLNGGSGGRPHLDGTDGTSFTGGWLRNVPNEVLEADMPVLVENYGYRAGSQGAGRRRGGVGIHFRLRSLAPEALMTSRGLERFTFRPWGLRGGRPGQLGRVTLNPGTAGERELGKMDVLRLERGDVVEFQTAGGGGFGDPFDREPKRVASEVESGLLDERQAENDYGVVFANGLLDLEATAARRLCERRIQLFDFGPEREAYERRWGGEVLDEIIRLLESLPSRLRPLVRGRMLKRLEGAEAAPSTSDLPDLFDELTCDLGPTQMHQPASGGAQ